MHHLISLFSEQDHVSYQSCSSRFICANFHTHALPKKNPSCNVLIPKFREIVSCHGCTMIWGMIRSYSYLLKQDFQQMQQVMFNFQGGENCDFQLCTSNCPRTRIDYVKRYHLITSKLSNTSVDIQEVPSMFHQLLWNHHCDTSVVTWDTVERQFDYETRHANFRGGENEVREPDGGQSPLPAFTRFIPRLKVHTCMYTFRWKVLRVDSRDL